MKRVLIALLITSSFLSVSAKDTVNVSEYEVLMGAKNFFHAIKRAVTFKYVYGTLRLSDDSISFTTNKSKYDEYNFSYCLNELLEVSKSGVFIVKNPYFLPILVKIKLRGGNGTNDTIWLEMTRRRRKFVHDVNSRMGNP